MRIVTLREIIQSVPAAFEAQYGSRPSAKLPFAGNVSCREVLKRLRALDLDTATPADVAAIVGNDSWAALSCDECDRSSDRLVRFGTEPDYDSRWQDLCADCLLAGFEMAAPEREAVVPRAATTPAAAQDAPKTLSTTSPNRLSQAGGGEP